MPSHRVLITLGCNTGTEHYLTYALSELRASISILQMSTVMQTPPVDFPYSSRDFLNVVLYASTTLSREALYYECKRIEVKCGRTKNSRLEHPELIPLDLDIVVWDNVICKFKDLYRPYVLQGMQQMLKL